MFQTHNEASQQSGSECGALLPIRPTHCKGVLTGKVRNLGKYEFSLDQKLGSGLTSDAYVGINKENKELVCVKVVDRETFKDDSQKALLDNEIQCQKKMKSDYIIHIKDVYDTSSFCFVVTELCEDGDLFKLIQFCRDGLPEPLAIRFGVQIAEALRVLKANGIIHRDIKSENILLSKGLAKLGDFGFAIEEK